MNIKIIQMNIKIVQIEKKVELNLKYSLKPISDETIYITGLLTKNETSWRRL